MRKGSSLLLWVFVSALYSLNVFGATLLNMGFEQERDISKIILDFDIAGVKATKFQVEKNRQIILDLKNVSADSKILRSLDTSEFSGSLSFVKAYKKPGTANDLRISLKLRENVRSLVERKGRQLVLKVENQFGAFSVNDLKEDLGNFVSKIKTSKEKNVLIPKSDSVEDILENLTLSGQKKYIGKKISIDVKDVTVSDVLQMIADSSGFNIITTEEVSKMEKLSINLINIHWDQALDTILSMNKLVATKNGGILMVTTLERVTKAKKAEIEAAELSIVQEPLVTKVFPISFAKTTDISKILEQYLTKERGSLSIDERTNFVIVKDTPSVIEKIRKIIEALDTQTPQVLIEAKMVEVTENYSKEIGLRNGLNFGYDPVSSNANAGASPVGSNPASGTTGFSSYAGPGFKLSTAPVGGEGERLLFGLTVKRFSRLFDLNFQLQLMESESKAKIVSAPKIITQNKKKATIRATDTTNYRVISGTGDSQVSGFEEAQAELKLDVTPQVTNDGSITLEIDITKEQFGARTAGDVSRPPEKQSRDVKTNVLVENGSTIVLAGLYSFVKQTQHSGVPFLKDVPLVGWLFRTPHAPSQQKSEMIIFITPRIINQEEAGFSNKGV